MTIELPPWLGQLLTFVVCAAAFLKGDVEERLTAGSIVINIAATRALRDYSWPQVQLGGFVADVLSLVLLLAIALRTHKFWPLAAAAFQLLMVFTHVAKMIDPNLGQWSYITAIVIWTYLLMIALGVGVWNNCRARSYAPSEAAALRAETRR